MGPYLSEVFASGQGPSGGYVVDQKIPARRPVPAEYLMTPQGTWDHQRMMQELQSRGVEAPRAYGNWQTLGSAMGQSSDTGYLGGKGREAEGVLRSIWERQMPPSVPAQPAQQIQHVAPMPNWGGLTY